MLRIISYFRSCFFFLFSQLSPPRARGDSDLSAAAVSFHVDGLHQQHYSPNVTAEQQQQMHQMHQMHHIQQQQQQQEQQHPLASHHTLPSPQTTTTMDWSDPRSEAGHERGYQDTRAGGTHNSSQAAGISANKFYHKSSSEYMKSQKKTKLRAQKILNEMKAAAQQEETTSSAAAAAAAVPSVDPLFSFPTLTGKQKHERKYKQRMETQRQNKLCYTLILKAFASWRALWSEEERVEKRRNERERIVFVEKTIIEMRVRREEGWLQKTLFCWIQWSRQEPQATNRRVRKEMALAKVAKKIQEEKEEREEEERVEKQKERDKEERKKRKLEKKMAMSKARCEERIWTWKERRKSYSLKVIAAMEWIGSDLFRQVGDFINFFSINVLFLYSQYIYATEYFFISIY